MALAPRATLLRHLRSNRRGWRGYSLVHEISRWGDKSATVNFTLDLCKAKPVHNIDLWMQEPDRLDSITLRFFPAPRPAATPPRSDSTDTRGGNHDNRNHDRKTPTEI